MTGEDHRPGPMHGIHVVELAAWVAAPAATAILADWGAEVVKVEPLEGDPARGMVSMGVEGINPPFEIDNRGKRSVGLDVRTPDGRDLLLQFIGRADVFVTNIRPGVVEEWGLAPDTLLERFPSLIVGTMTGYGHDGPHRDRPSYDMGGFWTRSGGASAHQVQGSQPTTLRGAYGDHLTASTFAGGIAAALLDRERTGVGRHVGVSLVRSGVWGLCQDLHVLLRSGNTFPVGAPRTVATNPLFNSYRSGDDRWFWLLGLQPDRHLPAVAAAIGRPELCADPRFATHVERRANAPALVAVLDEAFAARAMAEWEAIFAEHGVWYEPVLTLQEVLDDPVVQGAGAFVDAPAPNGGTMRTVASPVDFVGTPIRPTLPPPGAGEHTDELLAELGLDWDRIIELKVAGVVL
jgi:crotonobetainyl-CoA:carnitine CoA-transferase CaiB-like acyl-CoA transferase